MANMTYAEMLEKATADPTRTFARRKWREPGKFVWAAGRSTITAPDGRAYPLCVTLYFKDADDLVKPYRPSMDAETEAADWYEGVSGRHPAEDPV